MTRGAAAAFGVLAACSAAGADPAPAPGSGAPHASPAALPGSPASWKALPAVADAVAAAAVGDGVAVDAADAWGDPARGCYAVRLALHGGAADRAALTEQVLAGLAPTAHAPAAALTFSELVKPSDTSDVLAFSFARAPYRGRVRAQLAPGKLTALACFGNQREPAACTDACNHMLQGAP